MACWVRAADLRERGRPGRPAGLNFFAVRAGDSSTINADNRATCAAL